MREAEIVCVTSGSQPCIPGLWSSSGPYPWPAAHRYLSYTLNPDYIRKQDTTSTITSIASNVAGHPLVWDFVRSNWKKLFEK